MRMRRTKPPTGAEPMSQGQKRTAGLFDPTPWTWIRSLQDKPTSEQATHQLERLSERYWPCVYAYLRRCGRDSQSAADITQSFFADVILGRGFFERVDQDAGRFRDVLVQSLRHYNVDCARRESVPGRRLLPLDGELAGLESQLQDQSTISPEEEFNQRWASRTLFEAIRRCEKHFQDAGKVRHWRVYERCVLTPSLHGTTRPTQQQLREEFGFARTQHVANTVFSVNEKFRRYLRETVNETVSLDSSVAQQEYQYLLSLLKPNQTDKSVACG